MAGGDLGRGVCHLMCVINHTDRYFQELQEVLSSLGSLKMLYIWSMMCLRVGQKVSRLIDKDFYDKNIAKHSRPVGSKEKSDISILYVQ